MKTIIQNLVSPPLRALLFWALKSAMHEWVKRQQVESGQIWYKKKIIKLKPKNQKESKNAKAKISIIYLLKFDAESAVGTIP